ncbi:MAG: DUF2384 domain-containing protein [Cyclobacteriaceae bacterium]
MKNEEKSRSIPKRYGDHDNQAEVLNEPAAVYGTNSLYLLAASAISKSYIRDILNLSKLSVSELIDIVPISIDTYKRKTEFGSAVTEKVLEIEEVYRSGVAAFGDSFYSWMDAENVAFGGIRPKELLKNSFGVRLLLDEIGRMEHGVLA